MVPLWLTPLLFLLGVVPGLVLLFLTALYAVLLVEQAIYNPNDLLPTVLIGVALGLAWFLWMRTPQLIRGIVRWALTRRNQTDD